jgi:hypothetical protein
MTEDQYNKAQETGNIEKTTLADLGIEEPASPAGPETAHEDLEGMLYQLRNPLPTLTSVPVAPPRDITEQFRVVELSGAYHLYAWAGGAWRRAQLDAPKMQAQMYTLVIPGNVLSDTAATYEFEFPPKMVIGTARFNSGNAWAWGIFMDTSSGPENNAAPIGGPATGSLAGGNFLGLTTGTPGTYVRNLSVDGNTLHFNYGNSAAGSLTVDFWAIGTPSA